MRKGQKTSEETKQKIRIANLGKKHNIPDEHKKNLVKGGWNKGLKMSEEWREKLSKARLGKTTSDKQKRVVKEKWIGEKNPNWKGGINCRTNKRRLVKLKYDREKNATGHHSEKEWEELKGRFNFMCLCCKRVEPEVKLTKDHIIPVMKGGTKYISNIQPLCQDCNSRKYTKIINYISEILSNNQLL